VQLGGRQRRGRAFNRIYVVLVIGRGEEVDWLLMKSELQDVLGANGALIKWPGSMVVTILFERYKRVG